MVSKITCSVSNDVFQSIAEKGNVYDFLIIPIEEQICLDSISGWLPHFTPAKTKSNKDDSSALQIHTDSLIKMKEKGVNVLLSEHEEPMYVDKAQAVKRKLCLDMNESHKIFPQKRSRFKKKSKSLSGMNYRYLAVDNPKSNTEEELCIPKRSLSLPDIRQLSFSDENHDKISALESFTNVPSKWMKNFLEVRDAVEKEDDRLRTLISSSHSASEKQKLNSDVSDVPIVVINDASLSKKCGLKESKRLSCVRKLDWGECVIGKNLDERNSSKTPRRNKKLLDKTTVTNNFRTPVSQPITFNRASNVCNNVCTLPEVSLGYENALITKQIRANNWTRNYSPASSSGYIPCAQPEPVKENNIEKPFNVLSEASPANEQVVCVEKDVNKGADSDHAACSEELFESDDLGSGNHIQKQRPVASNKSKSGAGQKKSDKAAADLSVVFNKQDLVRSQGLTFTSVEVKKMCDVLLRLYSTQDG